MSEHSRSYSCRAAISFKKYYLFLKGTVPRDFWLKVSFMDQFPPSPFLFQNFLLLGVVATDDKLIAGVMESVN
jgi:hypothetical protein